MTKMLKRVRELCLMNERELYQEYLRIFPKVLPRNIPRFESGLRWGLIEHTILESTNVEEVREPR